MTFVRRSIPTRLATGAYVLHTGIEKFSGDDATAQGVHDLASGAYPFLGRVPPRTFLKALAIGEMTLGAMLLAPVVPNRLAGLALTAFSGGLVGMYLRSPVLHKPGSIWPTPAGIGVSKDVWMLGIGTGLLVDAG